MDINDFRDKINKKEINVHNMKFINLVDCIECYAKTIEEQNLCKFCDGKKKIWINFFKINELDYLNYRFCNFIGDSMDLK